MKDFARELNKFVIAAEKGNLSEVEKCLQKDTNILARNNHFTLLHSIDMRHEKVVKLILDNIKEGDINWFIDAKDTGGNTPLMRSVESEYINTARLLLEYGADVEAKNNEGITALHLASKKKNIEILKLLIDKNANINVKDKHGLTPSDYATEKGHGEVAGYLAFIAAEMFRKQGKYIKALLAYQEALDIQEVVLGSHHLDTLMTLHNMAVVLANQGKHSEALKFYQKVYDIQKRKDGPDHPNTLMTRYNMAVAYSDKGNTSEVLKIFREVLGMKGVELSSDHPVPLTSSKMNIIQMKKVSAESNLSEEDYKPKNYKDIPMEDKKRDTVDVLNNVDKENSKSERSRICSNLKACQGIEKLDIHLVLEDENCRGMKKDLKKHLKERFEDVMTVNGLDDDKHAWHILLTDTYKKQILKENVKTGQIDVADYGKILFCKFGEHPPEYIKDKINDFFLKRVSNDLFIIKEYRCFYHYVVIDADKREMFVEQTKRFSTSIFSRRIQNCGKVLYTGLGQDPPESISSKIICTYFAKDEKKISEKCHNPRFAEIDIMHDAFKDGKEKSLKFFVKYKSIDENGWNLLHHAAFVGNIDTARYLISRGINSKAKDTVCGRMPVHIAAKEGHQDIIELFLNENVKVSEIDENGWTPLHYAAWNGYEKTVELLIDRGADIYAKELNHGKKPIHIAAERGYMSIVILIIKLYYNSHKSVDDTDNEGRTSLYYAAWGGYLEVVKYLAGKGANTLVKLVHGATPLHAASHRGHINVIEFLLRQGANVTDLTSINETPLHYAAIAGHLEVVEYLLNEGANVQSVSSENGTPLHYAAEHGHLGVVKFLLKKGAVINVRNSKGKTPLDLARENGHKEIVEILDSLN